MAVSLWGANGAAGLTRLRQVTRSAPSPLNAQLYTLNREHLLAAAVQEMATAGVELIRRLRDAIGGWEVPAVHASLFGSAARGDGGIDSDIDLLIVRPRELDAESEPWRTQLEALAEQVHRWTGNHAGISEISETDLPRLRDEQPAILTELRSDAVDLAGMSTRTLLGDL
ncbi:MAG: nucleotidyltransferase domain-containing protein [Solirubrobacteraceae bacterium]